MEYRQPFQGERYVIGNMLRQRCSHRQIAQALDGSVATVSRELERNRCEYDGSCRAEKAHDRAMSRRWRGRRKSQYGLEEWQEVRRTRVHVPNPDGAQRRLEQLTARKWTWLVLPNNCASFVEETFCAGGSGVSSLTNCPKLGWD